ncbi:MAG: hypothetical protein J6Y69_11665, partial [Treponema sp.]|nr:hypothetical protein [Treponema sp.]
THHTPGRPGDFFFALSLGHCFRKFKKNGLLFDILEILCYILREWGYFLSKDHIFEEHYCFSSFGRKLKIVVIILSQSIKVIIYTKRVAGE